MTNMLQLNCWALGDDPNNVFSVEIGSAQPWVRLTNIIKGANEHAFSDIDAAGLRLWKVKTDLKEDINPNTLGIEDMSKIAERLERQVGSWRIPLSDVFTGGVDAGSLHIIVERCPASPLQALYDVVCNKPDALLERQTVRYETEMMHEGEIKCESCAITGQPGIGTSIFILYLLLKPCPFGGATGMTGYRILVLSNILWTFGKKKNLRCFRVLLYLQFGQEKVIEILYLSSKWGPFPRFLMAAIQNPQLEDIMCDNVKEAARTFVGNPTGLISGRWRCSSICSALTSGLKPFGWFTFTDDLLQRFPSVIFERMIISADDVQYAGSLSMLGVGFLSECTSIRTGTLELSVEMPLNDPLSVLRHKSECGKQICVI
ncbi:hypothetical protein K503DRAFT_834275 [Rhizopogon vinicolor AM-OR11-026]|uniref:Crinkler effector protein N-terminal domain-containing protein n=1 Tax=Rhizopogon vinicolor AM-OR11-026 TaxID=1314800 RepID=A0A1B7MNW2_9AGAM|nr:hypothetical protein K503DRAFT_834275 [Rhizopogon vinicolor AM-OR11-026]